MTTLERPHLTGATPINHGEFEVGFDARFERRWYYAELAGRAVMLLVVVAALAGLLGRGPFSHHTVRTADGMLAADYEPVARYGTTTQVTLHLPASPDGDREVVIDQAFVEPFGLQQIVPQPIRQVAQGGGLRLDFAVPEHASGQAMLVRLSGKPAIAGPLALSARLASGEALRWTQFVAP